MRLNSFFSVFAFGTRVLEVTLSCSRICRKTLYITSRKCVRDFKYFLRDNFSSEIISSALPVAKCVLVLFFFMAQQPLVCQDLMIEASRSHPHTHCRTPLDERSARRRDLYLTTQHTRNRHHCLRRDSNPQSQQASGRRPTP